VRGTGCQWNTDTRILGLKKEWNRKELRSGINYVTFHVFSFFIMLVLFHFCLFFLTFHGSFAANRDNCQNVSPKILVVCPLWLSIFVFAHVCMSFDFWDSFLVTNFDWHIEFSLNSGQAPEQCAFLVRSINWSFLKIPNTKRIPILFRDLRIAASLRKRNQNKKKSQSRKKWEGDP